MDIEKLSAAELSVVRGCFLFEGVAPDVINGAVKSDDCIYIGLAKGSEVSRIFDFGDALGLVVRGALEASRQTDHRVVLTLLTPGRVFGAATLFSTEKTPVSELTARFGSAVVFFHGDHIRAVMKSEYRIAENYMRFLTGRIRFLNDKIYGLGFSNAEAAVLSYFRSAAGSSDTFKAPSMSLLCRELNISRASLYRAMDSLEARGVIKREKRTVTLLEDR